MVSCSSVAGSSRLSLQFLVGLSNTPPSPFFRLPLLMQCDGCPDNYALGLMARLGEGRGDCQPWAHVTV